MSQELSGNLLVAQSGGPTATINASLAGVISEALHYEDEIIEIYGALNGIQGILNEQFIDLAAESQQVVRALSNTPGAALGSSCAKLEKDQDFDRLLDVFAAHDIRFFVLIGDADGLDTANQINTRAAARSYDLRVIGVPKSVDNDLPVTDHCPGYGSAAKHIAATVREIAFDAASIAKHDFVAIVEVNGRSSGWLAAASVLAKRRTALIEDAPHIILLPEERFAPEAFVGAVQNILRKQKFCVVVATEGLLDAEGSPLGAQPGSTESQTSVGEQLRSLVEQNLSGVRVRTTKLGISQRAAARTASQTDVDEALLAGREAVKAAAAGETAKLVALVREETDAQTYAVKTELVALESVIGGEKPFPASWIGEDKISVGYAFTKYATPLIQGEVNVPHDGGLPKFAQLAANKVPTKLDRYEAAA